MKTKETHFVQNAQFRIIVAGSRSFDRFDIFQTNLDYLLHKKVNAGFSITIVSGGAKGADAMGIEYAKQMQYKLSVFYADWKNLGISAGYYRNIKMAENADALVAFWNGESNGTRHMIDIAIKFNLLVKVVRF